MELAWTQPCRLRQKRCRRHACRTGLSAIRSCVLLLALILASCAAPDTQHQIVVSTREQKLALIDRGNVLAIYPVSTSKFGLGDWRGSRFTPLGKLQIAEKIGDQCAARRSVQGSTPHRRDRCARFSRPRSDRDAHSLAARTGGAKRERVLSRYLHSWHARGTAHRNASELWMHPDAFERHHTTIRHRRNWRCGHYRKRTTGRCRSQSGVGSFDG